MSLHYHLPEIELSPLDVINRRAAATGSVRYAQLTASSDYNGHPITISFKPHAIGGPKWNAEYHWGERIVIGRGSMNACLESAKAEYNRGAGGCCVRVYLNEEAPESIHAQRLLCEDLGYVRGKLPDRPAWWTGTHTAVSDSIRWDKQFPHYKILQHALEYTGTDEKWPAERDRFIELTKLKNAQDKLHPADNGYEIIEDAINELQS